MHRISTFRHFQVEAEVISKQFAKMDQLQAQVESGKTIQNSSEDPVLAGQIKSSQNYIDQLSTYEDNGSFAQTRGKLFDSSMTNAINAINQASNLIRQGQSDTNTNVRSNIAAQLQGTLTNLFTIANTTDANGNYIYAGYNTATPPYVKTGSGFQYQGGLDSTSINIAPGVGALYDESGFKVFGNIPQGNGTFTITAGAGNAGTASTGAGSITSVAAYVPDVYTVTFVTNSASQLAYQVVGSTSGQVIPTPPATTPASAPAYVAGEDIVFNGIHINVSGLPVVGDTFSIQPSQKQDIFTTLQNAINALNTSNNQGVTSQALMESGASLAQASSHFITYQSEVGTRNALVANQIKGNTNVVNDQQAILSQLGNADMASVFSALMQQSLALQATQEGYLKIQETLTQLLKL